MVVVRELELELQVVLLRVLVNFVDLLLELVLEELSDFVLGAPKVDHYQGDEEAGGHQHDRQVRCQGLRLENYLLGE